MWDLKIIRREPWVAFPPRASVAYASSARDVRVDQQVWVLEGAIDISLGDDKFRQIGRAHV